MEETTKTGRRWFSPRILLFMLSIVFMLLIGGPYDPMAGMSTTKVIWFGGLALFLINLGLAWWETSPNRALTLRYAAALLLNLGVLAAAQCFAPQDWRVSSFFLYLAVTISIMGHLHLYVRRTQSGRPA